MRNALLIVDVQNDFCEGGSLPVEGGAQVATDIGTLVRGGNPYDFVVASMDYHQDPGDHWSYSPDYQNSWPVHCEVGTPGAELHPNLALQLQDLSAVFTKGLHEAAYSAFEGTTILGINLSSWLEVRQVSRLDICGIATDYCVRASALDARREGFETRLLTDLCAGVAYATTQAAIDEMLAAGVVVVPQA